ncbi:carbohydrate binding domain-containing protein [Marixanthomonas ophiurae]|uniref:CBM-cenC domain-containing protein n=1 Tax=Marixanthomonas ophiurae TaxID=387659 RepID=A0A3E1Q9J7_9FLAO|nr:hypothetical protein [Marixanthomonas ophiurae]RFN58803.1 hypothetical protein DZ858_01605 [Marixanthomonas ophiurae]
MKNVFLILICISSNLGLAQGYKILPCGHDDNYKIVLQSNINVNYIDFKIIDISTGGEDVLCETKIMPMDQSFSIHQVSFFYDKIQFNVNSYDPITGIAFMYYDDPTSAFNGIQFKIDMSTIKDCIECIERNSITILHADTTEFSDDWKLNYSELKDESTDITGYSLSDIANSTSAGNPYAYGMKGIWRPMRTSAYLIDRLQSGNYGDKLRLDKDGEYKEFYWFDWEQPISYNENYNWRWVNEVTKYNVNGASKEGRNRLDIYAASLFGYNNHLVTASASNSKTTDIAFDGFEDYSVDQYNVYNGNGHGNLKFLGNTYQLSNFAHTGEKSLIVEFGIKHQVDYNQLDEDYFYPKRGKKYYISAWVSNNSIPDNGIIIVKSNATVLNTIELKPESQTIDGWRKLEGTFEIPITSNTCEILFSNKNDDQVTLFDDIRIQPFNSGMETYVYDPTNYRLKATLSNQNYATFYNYDEEGNLTQTKVETERGIKTISSNRNNIKK